MQLFSDFAFSKKEKRSEHLFEKALERELFKKKEKRCVVLEH